MPTSNIVSWDLGNYLKILLKRKWMIAACILITLLLVVYYNHTTLPLYKSEVTVVYEDTPNSMEISSVDMSLSKTFIMNQIEEIKSWSLINEVVKSTPDSLLETYPVPKDLSPYQNKTNYYTRILQDYISTSPIPNSDVIKISAKAHDPYTAYIIANKTAEVLKNRNLSSRLGELHNLQNTIENKLEYFSRKVEEAEVALRRFKESNSISFLDKESEEIFKRVTAAEVEYNKVQSEHKASKQRYEFVQDKLAKERKDLVPAITTVTSTWAQELKKKLIDLEVQYTSLKVQNYDDNHPKMKQLRSQINETKESLRSETLKIAQGETTIDPLSQIQQNLEELATLDVEIHTYEAQETALGNILKEYDQKLQLIPEKELELGRLLRDKDVADNIYTMLLQKSEETKITEAEKLSNIRIIDPARIPEWPLIPRKKLNLALGFLFGAFLGIALVFFLDFLDQSISSVEDLEKYTDFELLGAIPHIRIKERENRFKVEIGGDSLSKLLPELITYHELFSPVTDAFRSLRTNIQATETINKTPIRTVVVTSTKPEEGKSFISSNIAITMAQLGLKTLIIDADLRRAAQHLLFGKRMKPGLVEVMNELTDYQSRKADKPPTNRNLKLFYSRALKKSIQPTGIDNLFLLTSGELPIPNPSELLASKIMHDLNSVLHHMFDFIIYDMPPVLTVTDAAVLAPIVDGIVFVVRAGRTRPTEVARAQHLINKVSENHILGAVLNNIDVQGRKSYYGYQYQETRKKSTIYEYKRAGHTVARTIRHAAMVLTRNKKSDVKTIQVR